MPDELGYTERWLMGELFKLGQQVSGYVIRMLGADLEQAGQLNTEDEFRMGSRLVEMGTVMQARATKRAGDTAATEQINSPTGALQATDDN